jgi:hypothetical protein
MHLGNGDVMMESMTAWAGRLSIAALAVHTAPDSDPLW